MPKITDVNAEAFFQYFSGVMSILPSGIAGHRLSSAWKETLNERKNVRRIKDVLEGLQPDDKAYPRVSKDFIQQKTQYYFRLTQTRRALLKVLENPQFPS